MQDQIDNLEALVARSNLVPTAGEFIPKSQLNTPGPSGSSNFRFNNFSEEASASQARERNSNHYNHAGECDGAYRNRQSSEYYSRNREPKYTKNKQNKDKWKRTDKEFIKSNHGLRNQGAEKVNVVNASGSEVENGSSGRSWGHKRSVDPNKHQFSSGYDRTSYRDRNNWRSREEVQTQEKTWDQYQPYVRKENKPKPFLNKNSTKNGEEELGGIKFKNKRPEPKMQRHFSVSDKPENVKTNQREHLIHLLTKGTLECLVCCEFIYHSQPTWSCTNCYHVLHLNCICKWGFSSRSDDGWRCPACQHVTRQIPKDYLCFCGKVTDPEWNRNDCPHSCGSVCGRRRPNKNCTHKCNLLCHPGPCPTCPAFVTRHCGCGKISQSVQCSSSEELLCQAVCGKPLACSLHTCKDICHAGPCKECTITVHQECFCSKSGQDVPCTKEVVGVSSFSCGVLCGKVLSCGNHSCNLMCHEGECLTCPLSPTLVDTCPCGQTGLTELLKKIGQERTSCLDEVPTCGSPCGKQLICGQPGDRHRCQVMCHPSECPSCPLDTVVKCRCGHMDKTLPCAQLTVRADDARCDKRCSKKRNCGKHKCNQECCIDLDHECTLPCNRPLGCGLHRCEAYCHRGHCQPCFLTSFEELYCECGAQVMFPPVACGTRRPPCSEPCSRAHPCEHPPTHNCHSEQQCPPCTVLTKKYCHGRHELRKAVPCHQDVFSCGLPCGNEMPCGRHKCILPCHAPPCLRDGQHCVQPCVMARLLCGHACAAPCHEGPCPDTPCKEVVRVTCECGHRYTSRLCHDNVTEYNRIATAQLASKMADLQAGQTIDLNDVTSASKKLSYKTLECNDECRLIERNRRLAIALQIRNPDLSAKLTPRYPEMMKSWAKRDPRFSQMVHDKLTDLVQLAKQSKQKSRSYSFDPMGREKRHFIHEYCEHFGCESVAYDAEPKRNVVATALKDKSWLPSMSLLEVVQRENGQRKVPPPVKNTKLVSMGPPASTRSTMDVLPGKVLSSAPVSANSDSGADSTNPATDTPVIDYFDFT